MSSPRTMMVVMFEHGANARSHAGAGDAKGAATDQVVETFSQDPYVLSRARAVAVQHWAGDAKARQGLELLIRSASDSPHLGRGPWSSR